MDDNQQQQQHYEQHHEQQHHEQQHHPQQQQQQQQGSDPYGRSHGEAEAYGYQHHHQQHEGVSQTTSSSSLQPHAGLDLSRGTGNVPMHQKHIIQYSQHHNESIYHRPPQAGGGQHQEQLPGGHPPLLEIPEEIYAVRKAALQVLKPLTSSWLIVSVGFAISTLLGMARWTQLLPHLPYWFVLLPSWFTHVGLLWCHIRSARALSRFIQQANENRQRPDSTDHMDRTEYLPLLQRSLKFGLKTGLLSFCTFLFEVLGYVRIAKGTMPLGVCFIPVWMLVIGGVLDGIICKTQSFVRLACWILVLTSMILATMRIDYGQQELEWQLIVSPIIAVLSFASLALLYIVYGHQVGYYRLTESQLTAGILYSTSAVIAIVLVIVVAQVMPLSRPVEMETRFLVVVMAPLVVCLTGMGAYAVSRDEFGRLLLYGGQSAVHPMRLKWEKKGWTSVPTKGVVLIPMFGEVSYRPLERRSVPFADNTSTIGVFATWCIFYPFEQEDDESEETSPEEGWQNHPYLAPENEVVGRAVENA